MNIPNDPIILMSFINTRLRDVYASLDALCADMNLDRAKLCQKLENAGFVYNETQNQFR